MPKIPSFETPTNVSPAQNQPFTANVGSDAINRFGVEKQVSIFNLVNDEIQEKYKKIEDAEKINRKSEITIGFMKEADALVNQLKTDEIAFARQQYSNFQNKKILELDNLVSDPVEKAALLYDINRMSLGYEKDLIDNAEQIQKQKNLASLETYLFETEKQASFAADPAKRALLMQSAKERIDALVANGTIAADRANSRLMQMGEQIQLNAIQSTMQTSPAKALALLNNKDATSNISAENIIKLKAMAQQDIQQGVAKVDSLIGQAYKQAVEYELTPDTINQVNTAISQFGTKEQQVEWQRVQSVSSYIRSLSYKSPIEAEEEINTNLLPLLYKDGASKEEIMLVDAAQKRLSALQKQVSTNYLDYANQIKGAQYSIGTEDIFNNSSNLADRVSQSEALAGYYSRPMILFTQNELDAISNDMGRMNNEQIATFFKNIGNLGSNAATAAARQFNDKSLALTGAIATAADDPITSAKIFTGSKAITPNISKDVFNTEFISRTKNAVTDPQAIQALGESVSALYKSMALEQGILDAEIDIQLYDKAYKTLLGEPFEINGSFTLPYRNNNNVIVDSSRFFDVLDSATDDELFLAAGRTRPVDTNGSLATIEDIRDVGKWNIVDGSRYQIYYTANSYLSGDDGRRFTVDMKILDQLVSQRLNKPLTKKDMIRNQQIRDSLSIVGSDDPIGASRRLQETIENLGQ